MNVCDLLINKYALTINFQTYNIVILVSGQNETRELTKLMMTILSQRSTPLVIHVISDTVTARVVKLLFDTWELPGGE